MVTIPRQRRMQLVLFGETVAVPHWHNLAETTRVEVVKILAQLLLTVRTASSSRAPQSQGECDE